MSLGLFDGRAALGKPPSKYWADARVKQAQVLMNGEMDRWGCSVTLKTDGLIGPLTCGAMKFVRDASAATKTPIREPLKSLLDSNLSDFSAACSQVGTTAIPCRVPTTASAPSAAALTSGDIMVMQSLINDEALKKGGFKLLPEDGKLTPTTCGAVAAVYKAVRDGKLTVSATLRGYITNARLVNACKAHRPHVAPQRGGAPAPRPPPKPPASDPYSQCWIEYGARSAAVTEVQQQVNVALQAAGYEAIPVSGQWDAQTCGAVNELKAKGKLGVKLTTCPGGVVYPERCAETVPPKKKKGNLMIAAAAVVAVGAAGFAVSKQRGWI